MSSKSRKKKAALNPALKGHPPKPAPTGRKMARVTVSLGKNDLKHVDRAAKALGMNRSEFFRDALKLMIEHSRSTQHLLSDQKAMKAIGQAFAEPETWNALLKARSLTDEGGEARSSLLTFLGKITGSDKEPSDDDA